jgi:hypothetical protein
MEYKRSILISVRLTENERLVLALMSVKEGRRPSEMLREAIREAARRRGIPCPCIPHEGCDPIEH